MVVAFGAVWWIEKESGQPLIAAPRAPSAQERQQAEAAWAWFGAHTPTSVQDHAALLQALLAARQLGLLDEAAFEARMAAALQALGRQPVAAAQALGNMADPEPAEPISEAARQALALQQLAATHGVLQPVR